MAAGVLGLAGALRFCGLGPAAVLYFFWCSFAPGGASSTVVPGMPKDARGDLIISHVPHLRGPEVPTPCERPNFVTMGGGGRALRSIGGEARTHHTRS